MKIIEKDEARCEFLCETFPKATIIHGDATDHELLLEEGIQEADAMIALTGMDAVSYTHLDVYKRQVRTR